MRKSYLVSTALASGVAMTGAAAAQDITLRGFGGVQIAGNLEATVSLDVDGPSSYTLENSDDVDLENGFVLGGALGVTIGDVTIDLEGAFRDVGEIVFDVPDYYGGGTVSYDVDASLYSAMVNGWYELPLTPQLGLYAGAGIGLAYLDVDEDIDTSVAFAFQLGAGVRVNITDNVAIGGGYRYFSAMGLIDDSYSEVHGAYTLTYGYELDYTESSFIVEAVFSF